LKWENNASLTHHGHFLPGGLAEGLRPLHLTRIPLLDEILVAFRAAELEYLQTTHTLSLNIIKYVKLKTEP
jgi:hypothetical protein